MNMTMAYRAIISLLLCFCLKWSLAGEDRSLEGQRQILIDRADSVLIRGGACIDKSDCIKRQILFVSPSSRGLAVSIYGINNPETVASLLRVVVQSAEALTAENAIEAEFFSETRAVYLDRPFWVRSRPYLKVNHLGGIYAKR